MKNIALLLVGLFLSSCDKDNTDEVAPELVGRWQHIETLADPGDGSGTFVEVNSQKTITFSSDGTFVSNQTLCNLGGSGSGSKSGTYDINTGELRPDNCGRTMSYQIDGSHLIINYLCIERCAEKYSKVGDGND